MSAWYVVFVAGCIGLFIVPLTLVFHEEYKDGVVGRLALLGVAFFAALFLFEIFFGGGYHVEREEAGLVAAMALFFTWHQRRFCRRIGREKRARAAIA